MALTRPGPVLALRALGLGDALTGVPALRLLRRALPDRPLLLAASGAPADLLRRCGVVDDVVPTAGLDATPPGLGLGPHLAVNLHGSGPESHRLLLAGSPSRVVAFGRPDLGIPGPRWRADEHEVLRWCRVARAVDGPEEFDGLDLELAELDELEELELALDAGPDLRLAAPPVGVLPRTVAAAATAGVVVVHPGASSGARRWPADRFAAVARALAGGDGRAATGGPPGAARGLRVVVTGSPAEAAVCREVTAAAGLPRSANLCGRLDLPQLAALLGAARLLVCGDTGVAHLGTAVGTPSVLLFGPVSPAGWGPLVDTDRHRVLWRRTPSDPPGDPHGDAPDATLLRITVPQVLRAARRLLQGAPVTARRPAVPVGPGR